MFFLFWCKPQLWPNHRPRLRGWEWLSCWVEQAIIMCGSASCWLIAILLVLACVQIFMLIYCSHFNKWMQLSIVVTAENLQWKLKKEIFAASFYTPISNLQPLTCSAPLLPIHPCLQRHSLPITQRQPFSSSLIHIWSPFSFLLGLERGRNHSISPSVSQEPEIPASDAIWYKSIIMKVQHGAKWISTSAARGANDKTASPCSLARH